MIKRLIPSWFVCLLLLAQPAAAHSFHQQHGPQKHGQVFHGHKGPKPCAPSAGDDALQGHLDDLVVSGPPIDAGAPSGIDLWDNTSGPMTAQVVVDNTGHGTALWFGMYPENDPANRAFILSDSMSPEDIATVTFLDTGSIVIRGGIKPKVKAEGFDGPFGFFAKVASAKSDSPVYLFTQADLNGGQIRAKVFQGNDQTVL